MKIVIVGAGLGGLTAAVTLAKKGHDILVIERQDQLWSNGGGINISPQAAKLLNAWGLEEDLVKISDHTAHLHQRELLSGEITNSFDLSEGQDTLARTVLRSDLSPMLYQAALQAGAKFEFGQGVTRLSDDGDLPSISLEDGTTETADLIIAADGVRSRSRYQILSDVKDQHSLDPVHSNRTYYLARLEKPPSDMQIVTNGSPTVLNFWAGKDDKFAISLYNPTRDNLSAVYCVREAIEMDKLWDEDGEISHVRDRFAALCHPELQKILDIAKGCERWQLSQMPDLPRWRSVSGRSVLLGDAAHAMHPTAGSGYSSTVEEVAVLALLLEKMDADTAGVTKAWEEVCKPRSERLKAFSSHLSLVYEGDPETLLEVGTQMQRQGEMRAKDPDLKQLKGDRDAGLATPEFSRWLSKYDPVAEAKQYLARRSNVKTNGNGRL